MKGTTIAHINRLSAERRRLYGQVTGQADADAEVVLRLREISGELERLWEERRRERAGRREGVDLVIERAYARTYGVDFEGGGRHPEAGAPWREPAGVAA